jgi:beta-lactamase superfamily II metal-dependent hydrolase
MSPAAQSVSIRMYDVGFGDSFLLTFPAPDRPRRVLIDCGVHPAGPPEARPFKEVVAQILADLKDGAEAHVDLVVCSHRHRDHVVGFENEGWSNVRVSQVWMPWTEDPSDPEARRIRQAQGKKAAALARALALSGAGDDDTQRAREIVENNLTNAKAMAMLHGGFAGRPPARFLPESPAAGQPLLPQSFETPLLPGVKVHVLGPGRDRDTIRDMDPPQGESFLRAAAANGSTGAAPLDSRWAVSARGAEFRAWFKKTEEAADGIPFDPSQPLLRSDPAFLLKWFKSLELSLRDVSKVDHFATDSPLAAAVALEQAVNGTSLMLMFEIGRAILLFPGDAQWGTWDNALKTSRPLLERTNFLKVGHHGSHNASPKTFVEGVLGTDFKAMVSTRPTKLYKQIPRLPLLEALEEKQAVPALARSDAQAVPSSFRRISDICVEATVAI